MYFGTKTFIILLKLQRQRQQKKLCILLTKCFFSFLPFFYSCNFDFVESKKFFFVQLRLCETKKKIFFLAETTMYTEEVSASAFSFNRFFPVVCIHNYSIDFWSIFVSLFFDNNNIFFAFRLSFWCWQLFFLMKCQLK